MIDFTKIDKAFYTWVKNFTGESVIWWDQNGPRPERPYLTLRKSSLLPLGHDFYADVESVSGFTKIGGVRQLTLQINHYGVNSIGVLEGLCTSLWIEEYSLLLREAGITFLNRLAIQDLTDLLDTRFEDRSQMDMLFLIGSQTDNVAVGVVEDVNGTGTYKEENSTIKEIDFEIDTEIGG